MNNIVSFQDIIGASQGNQTHMLGKFLYFSLSNILVEKDQLAALCETLHIPYAGGKRVSVADAFRSATGDIKDRLVIKQDGEQKIYAIYCRDNERSSELLSRELVKETLNQRTNRYEKLANIYYDRNGNLFGYENICFDVDVDAITYCQKAEELFELYQQCANRRQIETICLSYLRSLEATKVSSTGHLYFVPRHNIHVVYTKEAETADQYIEKFAHENAKKYRVTVATSDGLEQIIIRGAGCLLLSARDLEQEIREKNQQLMQDYQDRKEKSRNYLLDDVPDEVLRELKEV